MITVIIPFFNSNQTLKKCLDAVFSNKFEKFEVITISDNSEDNSIDIAKNYNCKIIELKQNKGPAFARNTGANSASGDILLFVDSDVIVKEDILMHVNNAFNNKTVNVVQGVYSHEPNYKNIITQYQQSFYCYYTWHKQYRYTDTLSSMCIAVRKNTFLKLKGFNTNIKKATTEDEEFGHKLIDDGNKILISRDLNVEHSVNYTIGKFIRRNFTMYVETMKSFIRNKSYIKKVEQKNYSNVLAGIPLIGLIILVFIMMIFYSNGKILIIFLILNTMFLLLHLKFTIFVGSAKGLLKALGVMICCYLDSFLMLIGIVFANISYIFGRKY